MISYWKVYNVFIDADVIPFNKLMPKCWNNSQGSTGRDLIKSPYVLLFYFSTD